MYKKFSPSITQEKSDYLKVMFTYGIRMLERSINQQIN